MAEMIPDLDTSAGILRLGNTFCDAKALLTAVELDLFSSLRTGPATAEEIRQRLGLHGRGLSDFLNLLTALGLLTKESGRYRNTASSDRHLVPGEQTYIGGFLHRSNRNLYPAWGRLGEALRTGKPQSGSDFGEVVNNPAVLGQFIHMMDALTQVLSPELAEAVDWPAEGSILDIGGCRGNLVGHLLEAHPGLTGHVFDLPQMEPFCTKHIASMGLTGKVTFHGGDFFADALPAADIVILGHVLHDWDEQQRGELTRKAYQAVNPGGALLVYDRMLDDDPRHVENLVISLDMLLVTDGGSEYPVAELRRHAEAAGCSDIVARPLGDYDTLVICRKP